MSTNEPIFAVYKKAKKKQVMRKRKPLEIYEGDDVLTSNAMWSFPTRISNSCLPTMFFFGQFVSSSLLKKTMRIDDRGKSEVIFGRSRGSLLVLTDYYYSLDDLALLHDTLQFFHDERADPHWLTADDTIKKSNLISFCVEEGRRGWAVVNK
jgi:hypothetical protein